MKLASSSAGRGLRLALGLVYRGARSPSLTTTTLRGSRLLASNLGADLRQLLLQVVNGVRLDADLLLQACLRCIGLHD
eukprot:1549789-Rhodomonas_salina.2